MTSQKHKKPNTDKNRNATPSIYMMANVSDLKPYEKNAKKHPAWQIDQIAESIKHFRCINPLIVTKDFEIIAGHGRFEAALKIGLKQIPVILVEHLTEAQIKAYRITDNKTNINTGFDSHLLKVELSEIQKIDDSFDLQLTGHTTGELDLIFNTEDSVENDELDLMPEAETTSFVNQGDLWILGKHRLLCGSALEATSYELIMGDELADAVLTDPPFNVAITGHVCGNGRVQHDEFAMASGEMSDEEFEKFIAAFIVLLVKYSRNGSLHYIFMDWRSIDALMLICRKFYQDIKNLVIWNKSNGGMGSMYRSKHELIVVCKNGSAPHINNVHLGKYGRYRSNVWDYPGVNSFSRSDDLKMHPTVKPVAMMADAIMDCTDLNGIVLDPFAGSGTTLIAAEKVGRFARVIELEPKYCDLIIRRWQDLTGQDAVHAASGKPFNQIEQEGSDHE